MNGTTTPRVTDARLSLPAEIDSVALARAALTRALRQAGWDGDSSGLVILAATEAMANAVLHGSTARGEVRIALAIDPGLARIRVVDEGRPGARCPGDARDLPPDTSLSGRGLYIMRTVADHCDVHSEGDGTEVVMEFLRAA